MFTEKFVSMFLFPYLNSEVHERISVHRVNRKEKMMTTIHWVACYLTTLLQLHTLCSVEQRRSLTGNGFKGDCHDQIEVYLDIPFGKAEERKSQTWQLVTSSYHSSAAAAADHHYHQGKEEYDEAGAQNKVANENDDPERRKATTTAIEGWGSW